jgi:hypothetical protein
MATTLRLRLDPAEIPALASRFGESESDAALEREVAVPARWQGYLTHAQLARMCEWKSPRIRPRCRANDPLFVEEATRAALGASSERLRIGALMLLDGVGYPMASVILHWLHADRYPILDVRALWSVGVDPPPAYTFDLWAEYTAFTRELAAREGVTMRVLDRALWQFAFEQA